MPRQLDPDQLYEDVLRALRAYHAVDSAPGTWLEGLRLVEQARQKLPDAHTPSGRRRAANTVLLALIEDLSTHNALGAQVVRARYLDTHTAEAVASQLHRGVDSVNRIQRQAVRHLAQALAAREAAARAEAAASLEASLPPSTYVELIGQAAARQQVAARLLADGAPWIVAVVGMGGLGKTALADAAAREAIKTLAFSRVVWLRVETPALAPGAISPEHLGQAILNDLAHQLGVALPDGLGPHAHLAQLRQVCKHEPLLVIIDNLEADADTVYLVEQLAALAGPTRFLLTARTPPAGQAAVYLHLIQELDRADALRLLQQTAGYSGQHDVERAPEALLGEIHAVVGGNPLALKLVAGLLRVQPLRQILDDLQHHPRGEVEALYRRLYQRLWPTLSPAARAVLEAMPLAAAGGTTADHLLAITALPPDAFWPALGELANRSLLEVRGSLQERRYSIHRMTEMFIRLDIIDWRD